MEVDIEMRHSKPHARGRSASATSQGSCSGSGNFRVASRFEVVLGTLVLAALSCAPLANARAGESRPAPDAPGDGPSADRPAFRTGWRQAEPGYVWEFPRDHFAHRAYQIEWWYFTGHLNDASQVASGPLRHRFAYQFTLFRIGLVAQTGEVGHPLDSRRLDSDWDAPGLLMGHAAITDIETGEHRFSELLYREAALLAGFGRPGQERIAWTRAPVGTDADWQLRLEGDGFVFQMSDLREGFGFELRAQPGKPLVFQGPGGLSRKSDDPGAASLYYSFPRLRTEGTLRVDERAFAVRGQSWMDKEISSRQLSSDQVGWDWFSLQLDDGRELMLFQLRDSEGRVSHARGTQIQRDGSPEFLDGERFEVAATDYWRSPVSGIRYPAGWTIDVPGFSEPFEVVPLVADQENRSRLSRSPKYWEGAVELRDARGQRLGVGFVELTGYGADNRPPL